MAIESTPFADSKKLIREKIIPWEGLARADIISSDQADLLKILENQLAENRRQTVLSQLDLYANTILSLLSKLDVNLRDDVLKNILVLINDLFLDLPKHEFLDALLSLSSVDASLPYDPFVKHLDNNDALVKTLSAYNLVLLLTKASKEASKVDTEILIRLFDLLSGNTFVGSQDQNAQSLGVQLLQELVIVKSYKLVYQQSNLVSNFRGINQLINASAKLPNASNLQLLYNVLLTTWVLSFNASINRVLVHNFPGMIGSLFAISKELIKLKVVRISVSILRNFVSVSASPAEQFKTIKLLLFHDGLTAVKTLQERKFASNGSDEELSGDLAYLSDTLSEVVTQKLTSLDEYLTELENPNLISWSSPTHKSSEFWLENAGKFRDLLFKLVKKIFDILAAQDTQAVARVILLNDVQFLIKNLGHDLVQLINSEKDGQYKLLVMGFLENNGGDNELKYEALKTIQLLVGHGF